jgi:hypothetical protein
MHALIFASLVMSTTAPAAIDPTVKNESGLERGWDGGSKIGAIAGAAVGALAIGGGTAALVVAAEKNDQFATPTSTAILAGAAGVEAAMLGAVMGVVPGVLAGGGIGAGLGLAGVVESGPEVNLALLKAGDHGLWDDVNVLLAGGARRVGQEPTSTQTAPPVVASNAPPPLLVDPADR